MTGYSVKEIEEMRWPDDFFLPDTADFIKIGVNTLDKGENSYRFDGALVQKDNSVINVQMFVHKYNPPRGKAFYFSFVSDITEHVQSEIVLTLPKRRLNYMST